ncbi:hypothetical protein KUM39_13795 [Streptomyces sp. J2-1]|uniref:hypothetical protein n=1 Tax=Streptomyces corallincola TaxID=2851888 RepID=UPI001C38D5F0|nr:hypothetical protein [Streptomyces corallincola]MBV2355428.1 hypothetical protein [Streptomyces corallincola]
MITPWDDYPVHQTPMPVAHPASGDPAHYERYWFGFFDREATTAVGFGLSLHPNLGVADAAFSVSHAGRQTSLFASTALRPERPLSVGPLSIEVVRPLRTLRVVADEHEGLGGEFVFHAHTDPAEEPRTVRTAGLRTVSDVTRVVQFGSVEGTLTTRQGGTTVLDRSRWLAVRNRSWGVRSLHGGAGGGTPARPAAPPEAYFVWSVLHFDDECLHTTWHEDPAGNRSGVVATALPVWGADPARQPLRGTEAACAIRYLPGTRRPAHARLRLGPAGGPSREVEIEARVPFLMKGLGYGHPDHAFGAWHGGETVSHESWNFASLGPADRTTPHTQSLSLVRTADGRTGTGLFEHGVFGRHTPSGMPDGTAAPTGE